MATQITWQVIKNLFVYILATGSTHLFDSIALVGYPSGQRKLTVNQLGPPFGGSNPSPTTIEDAFMIGQAKVFVASSSALRRLQCSSICRKSV